MKKTLLLHEALSAAIAGMGHGDSVALVDAGYSVPRDAPRIDVALRPGVPRLTQVIEAVMSELCVASFVLAEEMGDVNPALMAQVERLLVGLPWDRVPQSQLKELVAAAKVVVRTGEYSPYGNVVLIGGVTPAFLEGASRQG